MARALNVKLVETAKPDPARRIEIPDGALAGLYLVVQPSGSKSWAVRYRNDGKPAKLTLGPYPRLPLGEAREAAREALRHRLRRTGPHRRQGDPRAAQAPAEACAGPRFEKVLARFIAAQKRKGRRSADETRRILEKDALPRWKGRPIASITAADVVEAVETLWSAARLLPPRGSAPGCLSSSLLRCARSCVPTTPFGAVEDPVSPKVYPARPQARRPRARACLARGRERSVTRSGRRCSSSP